MGVARLLAKGWVLFCAFAGAHALRYALAGPGGTWAPALQILVCVFLFAAMGLLFIGGYGASTGPSGSTFLSRLRPRHFAPGFNELVFVVFTLLSFLGQVEYAPQLLGTPVGEALQGAIGFAVPGQSAFAGMLAGCSVDGGRIIASAFTWMLALIFLASALSRVPLSAALVRLERKERPEVLGPAMHALLLGVAAVVGIQFFYVGSGYQLFDCTGLTGLLGMVMTGLAPLMLAYLIMAAIISLFAMSAEAPKG